MSNDNPYNIGGPNQDNSWIGGLVVRVLIYLILIAIGIRTCILQDSYTIVA